MATEPVIPDVGQKALNEIELRIFEASLRQLVPFIKRIAPYGAQPYTKMIVPMPDEFAQGGQ